MRKARLIGRINSGWKHENQFASSARHMPVVDNGNENYLAEINSKVGNPKRHRLLCMHNLFVSNE
jgi:hypothetical protein